MTTGKFESCAAVPAISAHTLKTPQRLTVFSKIKTSDY
jgi:hypothetical protein